MILNLEIGESATMAVHASEVFSSEKLAVEAEQEYQFTCDSDQRWTDWVIKTTPEGFFNILAFMMGLRVKKVKCFCLCGAFNENDQTSFAIGKQKLKVIEKSGEISFFPNDSKGYYQNNYGSIELQINRIK